MKNKFLVTYSLVITGLAFLTAITLQISETQQKETEERCYDPVGSISKENLLGTWVAGSPDHMDKLVIRADGKYQQIIHIEFPELPPIDYESEWQPWHLEYSQTSIPYLHLQEFAFCAVNVNMSCLWPNGDGYDFCTDKYLPMNGEGILVVSVTSEKSKNSQETHFFYNLDYPMGSENSYFFRLVETLAHSNVSF